VFVAEAQTLAKLRHSNIAAVIHAGQTLGAEPTPYLVMEHVNGGPDHPALSGVQALADKRLSLFQEILAAVAYLHSNDPHRPRGHQPTNVLFDNDLEASKVARLRHRPHDPKSRPSPARCRLVTPLAYSQSPTVRGENPHACAMTCTLSDLALRK